MVPISEYPISIVFVRLGAPHSLGGTPISFDIDGAWSHFFTAIDIELLHKKYDLSVFATSSIDAFALCRTLAKIAHAYTVAELGMEGFAPLLPNYILGNFDGAALYYVGGVLADVPASDELHEIGFEQVDSVNWQYHVVRIRLFARYGAPVYRVVAGRRLKPAKPLEVLLAEANAPHTGDKRPFADSSSNPIPEGLWGPNAPSSHASSGLGVPRYFRLKASFRKNK